MKNYVTEFHIKCGHLTRLLKGKQKIELVVFGSGIEENVALTDLENGNQRPARVEFRGETAFASFESLMDFQLFECALQSHGFKTVG